MGSPIPRHSDRRLAGRINVSTQIARELHSRTSNDLLAFPQWSRPNDQLIARNNDRNQRFDTDSGTQQQILPGIRTSR